MIFRLKYKIVVTEYAEINFDLMLIRFLKLLFERGFSEIASRWTR
jgi:hypothetical protein